MSLIPDSPQNEGASATDVSLEAGLAALKQGDYSSAIAHLEGILGLDASQNTHLRAQMGLVMAYERTGEPQQAIALCQNLLQSGQPKVEQWASNTLTDLAKRYSHLLNAPDSSHQAANTLSEASDATGFMPLDETPPSAPDVTGFVSFDPTPQQQQSSRQTPSSQPFVKGREISGRAPGNRHQESLNPTNLDPNSSPSHSRESGEGINVSRGSDFPPSQATASETGTSTRSPLLNAENQQAAPSTRIIEWRQAGRAQDWRPLKPIKLGRLLFVQVVTAIVLFWVIRVVVGFGMATTNNILLKLPYGQPIQAFYADPTVALWLVLAILLCASPWLIDRILKQFYGLKPLPLSQLASQYPETARVVQRYCRQRGIPLPTLGILPALAPAALTYGNLPRTARIVITQGLLEQLADDEIATVFASELGHIVNWDFVFMSLILLVVQLPYIVYWQVAEWGDRMKAESEQANTQGNKLYFLLFGFTFIVAVLVAAISYSVYWLFRWPALWFSRTRTVLSDRRAAEITGNPNGFTRALLKMSIGIANDIKKYRATSWFLEGFDLLMPLGHRQAISLGSYSQFVSFESLLRWDCTNPYRHWLVINYAHPLTGDRLRLLGRFAQYWQLETELDLDAFTQPSRSRDGSRNSLVSAASGFWQFLLQSHKVLPLLQSAILSGLVMGLALKGTLWLIGWIGNLANIRQILWLYQDRNGSLLMGSLLIGFSISIFAYINAYFPDITPSNAIAEPNLLNLYDNPTALPSESQPVSLTGQLLGRRGISNWLGQDLILNASSGLVKLNFQSQLGPLGNLLPLGTRPSDLVDRQVTATGWFRRGVTPWIDIETLDSQSGKTSHAGYPVWLTIVACAAAIWGAYIIWQSA